MSKLPSPFMALADSILAGARKMHAAWDMTECAAILLDSGGFLEQSLAVVRDRMRKNGARKVQKGDRWYWILKEDFTPGEIFEV